MRKLARRDGESDEEYAARVEQGREVDRRWRQANREHLRDAERRRLEDPGKREVRRALNRESYRRRREDPEYREKQDQAFRERARLPDVREARREADRRRGPTEKYREYARKSDHRRRAPPDDHPGTCDLCGATPKPRSNGFRGLCQDHRHDNNIIRGFLCARCNIQVGVLDLAFTDPDRFAALRAWSMKGAPAVPMRSDRPARRRAPPVHPKLFDED